MEETTKNQIMLTLETLRQINVENGVSMGFDSSSKSLMFFDTTEYLKTDRIVGFNVALDSLIK